MKRLFLKAWNCVVNKKILEFKTSFWKIIKLNFKNDEYCGKIDGWVDFQFCCIFPSQKADRQQYLKVKQNVLYICQMFLIKSVISLMFGNAKSHCKHFCTFLFDR